MENLRRKTLAELLVLVGGLGLVAGAFWLSHRPQPMPRESAPDPAWQEGQWARRRQDFFAAQIVPLIDIETERNQEAIYRGKRRLDELFQGYRQGIPRFVEALTSWGMRYRITKSVLGDWWSKTNRTAVLASELFAKHVVSDQRLREDVKGLVAELVAGFEADRNQMLTDATARLRTADFPLPGLVATPPGISDAFTKELNPLLADRARQSPMISVLALGSSVVAEEGTRMLVGAAMRMLTASLAASAASTGGATATSAAGGATGGTVVSPGVGTAIGVAAGIIVGVVVDWWMESQFKAKLNTECQRILGQMRAEIWSNKKNGLRPSFELLAKTARECHLEAMRRVVTGGV